MSEREKARTRAQGALENFLEQMGNEIADCSDNYKEEFWEAIGTAMELEVYELT